MTGERSGGGWFSADRVLGLFLAVIAIAGLADIRYGQWRSGPGIGPHLIPSLAHAAVLLAALALLARRGGGAGSPAAQAWRQASAIAIALVWAVGFFLAVLKIGLFVATAAFLAAAFHLLRPEHGRRAMPELVIAALGAGIMWLLFTRLAPIVVSEPLLF